MISALMISDRFNLFSMLLTYFRGLNPLKYVINLLTL
jgi:hypothetical protein